jgi:hypothetical protein
MSFSAAGVPAYRVRCVDLIENRPLPCANGENRHLACVCPAPVTGKEAPSFYFRLESAIRLLNHWRAPIVTPRSMFFHSPF